MPRVSLTEDTSHPLSDQQNYDSIGGASTSFDVLKAATQLGYADNVVSNFAKYMGKRDLESRGGELLPASKLNEMFPGMEKPFSEPATALVGQYISDNQYEKQKLVQKIAQGPSTFLGGTLPTFAGAMIGHLADPVELTAGLAAGAGIAAAARGGYFGVRAAQLYQAGAAGAAGTNVLTRGIPGAIKTFAEGAAGAAPVELTSGYFKSQHLQENYETGDFVKNVFEGALAFSALHYGVSTLASALERSAPKANDVAIRNSQAQLLQDKSVDTSLVTEAGPYPGNDIRNAEHNFGEARENPNIPIDQDTYQRLASQEHSPQRAMDYNPESDQALSQASAAPEPQEVDMRTLGDVAKNNMAELDALRADGKISEEHGARIDDLKSRVVEAQSGDSIYKAVFACLSGLIGG